MSAEDLASVFRKAREVVVEGGLDPDSPIGVAAFEKAVEALSQSPASRPHEQRAPAPVATGGPQQGEDPTDKIAAWLEVAAETVRDAIDFSGESLEIHLRTRQLPSTKAQRQRVLGLLLLSAARVAYDQDAIPARELNALCDRYDALDQNLPGNLANFKNYVTRRGTRGAFSYRITQYGLEAGQELWRELLNAG